MLEIPRIQTLLQSGETPKITVFGDFCLDKYLLIDSARDEPSLETGKTAFQVTHQKLYAGAAGTITNNLRALGAEVECIGLVGDDGEGWELLRCLEKAGAKTSRMVSTSRRNTCTYIKPMHCEGETQTEGNRLDLRNFTPTPRFLEEKLLENLAQAIPESDAVMICDQYLEADCAVVTSHVRETLCRWAETFSHIPFYADSRGFIDRFSKMLVKCNDKELAAIFDVNPDGLDTSEIRRYAGKLSQRTGKPVFITLGPKGVLLAEGETTEFIPGYVVPEPLDICGAGDAWNAGMLFALTKKLDLASAALVGNTTSSIVIQQIGVTGTASLHAVRQRIRHWPNVS
ncbi:MAG: PfkB family carbohydrate kinase [Planctomycetia bacterium]|nr:PfkB family carbohydrate kinase [Planctomycetia bacterium]